MRYNEETIKGIIKYNKGATEKIEEQQEEIERLNNIINGLEKWLIEQEEEHRNLPYMALAGIFDDTLDKIKELKNCTKESQNDAIKSNDEAIKGE